jgi:hypothetical protein
MKVVAGRTGCIVTTSTRDKAVLERGAPRASARVDGFTQGRQSNEVQAARENREDVMKMFVHSGDLPSHDEVQV